MRHPSEERTQAWRLLDRVRTIAVLGAVNDGRRRSAVAQLERLGYTVRLLATPALSDVGGPIDLVLVLDPPPDVPQLLREAAAKRADGVWFTGVAPEPETRALAARLALDVITYADIVGRLKAWQRGGGRLAGGRAA